MMLTHGGDPTPIDRDPLVDCRICRDSYRWQDYWKPRIMEADDPRHAPYWCDECEREVQRLRRRLSYNQKLTEFQE